MTDKDIQDADGKCDTLIRLYGSVKGVDNNERNQT